MEGLQGAIEERGIEVLSDTRAQKLYRDADGVVVGAHVEAKSGETLDIRATKGRSAGRRRLGKQCGYVEQALPDHEGALF